MLIYFAVRFLRFSQNQVANKIGQNHATIKNAVEKLEFQIESYENIRDQYREIKQILITEHLIGMKEDTMTRLARDLALLDQRRFVKAFYDDFEFKEALMLLGIDGHFKDLLIDLYYEEKRKR